MKRIVAVSAMALALSACGGPDFMVVVNGSPGEVETALASLDTHLSTSSFGVQPAVMSRPGPGEVLYTIPGFEPFGDGKIHFTIESEIGGTSRIKVDIEVPPVPTFIDGEQMVISEKKIEKLFEEEMRDWGKSLKNGGQGSVELAELASSIGMIAVSLQRSDQIGDLASGAYGGSDFADITGSSGDYSGYEEPSGDASPMSDPEEDAAGYGEPTADTYAYEESAFESSDSDYGGNDWGEGSY